MIRCLVVDDDAEIRDAVQAYLQGFAFDVSVAENGAAMRRAMARSRFDIVVLDLMLPGIQGLEVCRRLRADPELGSVPIVMLTAKGEEVDKVLGLEMGADDYITKPFSVKELAARVKAVLRRTDAGRPREESEIFEFKGLRIDMKSYEVTVDGRRVTLSPTEFKLLRFLTRNPGRVYSRDQILDRVWGDESFVEPRTVDVHVRRLRAQIERDENSPAYIVTVRGVGYKFADR